jgi:hypothetical protein
MLSASKRGFQEHFLVVHDARYGPDIAFVKEEDDALMVSSRMLLNRDQPPFEDILEKNTPARFQPLALLEFPADFQFIVIRMYTQVKRPIFHLYIRLRGPFCSLEGTSLEALEEGDEAHVEGGGVLRI